MNALLLAGTLLGFCPGASGEAWWSKDWQFRRPLTLINRMDAVLGKGFTMQVEIDPDYLGLRAKSRPGLEDWALVRAGERVPLLVLPGRGKTVLLCFRTAADIRAEGSDGYFLYYGAPEAAPAPARPDQVFEFWEDFSRPEALAERFLMERDLTASVQDGALVIREVAAGRNAASPARLAFRTFPSLAGFELSFDVDMDSSDAAAAGFGVRIEMKEPGANDPSMARKLDGLVEQLGDDAWQAREKATRELIALGRPAVAKLQEAARSKDAEVKWRAAHILKEIAGKSPAPLVSAGIAGGDASMPVALTSVIGKNEARWPHRAGWPVRTRITVQRDADGDVKVLWNGRSPQSGPLPGEIQQVALSIHKGGGAALGTIRIDNIMVRRFVDDDSRPASTVDLEQVRP